MTSYITRTMATQHIDELIHQAEGVRVRRELRQARRSRSVRRRSAAIGTRRTNVRLRWA